MKKLIPYFILLFIATLILLAGCSSDNPVDPIPSFEERAATLIDQIRAKYQIQGAGYTVLSPVVSIKYGFSGKATNSRNLSEDKLWHFTSNTKMVTSVIIMQMVEEGKISLDDPVKNYDVNYPNIDNTYTIKNLLTHTTNYFDYPANSNLWIDVYSNVEKVWNVDDVLQQYVLGPTSNTSYSYSNTNYAILGRIIEKVEGKPLDEVANTRIFSPLSLTKTQFSTKGIPVTSLNGVWYKFGSGAEDLSDRSVNAWLSIWGGAGTLTSSTYEMALLVKGLLKTNMLKQTSIDLVLTPTPGSATASGGWVLEYGQGFITANYNGNKIYGHGGTGLHKTYSMYDRTNDITVVVAYNNQGDEDSQKIQEMLTGLYYMALDEL